MNRIKRILLLILCAAACIAGIWSLGNGSAAVSDNGGVGTGYSLLSAVSGSLSDITDKLGRAETHLPDYDGLRTAGAVIKRSYDGDMVPFVSASHAGYPSEGYYEHLFTYPVSDETIRHATDELKTFRNYLNQQGIGLVYIQAANKVCQDERLPKGAEDYSNQNFDRLLAALSEADVPYIDTREVIHDTVHDVEPLDDNPGDTDGIAAGPDKPAEEEGILSGQSAGVSDSTMSVRVPRHHSAFYKTDHHWKAQLGPMLADEVLTFTNDRGWTDADLALLDKDCYEAVTFKGAMFGSDGESVGRGYAIPEDYSFMNPIFETDFTVIHHDDPFAGDEGETLTGTFSETMMDIPLLQEQSASSGGTGGYVYEQMMGGNKPLTTINNQIILTEQKLSGFAAELQTTPEQNSHKSASDHPDNYLLIMDSYGLCIAPYISLTGGQTWIVDRRPENGNYQGSIHELVEELQPSVVIVLSGNVPGDFDYD